MPGFIAMHRNNGLPIIDCEIAYPQNRLASTSMPPVTSIFVRALIDTGASHVVISPDVLSRIPLPHIGEIENSVVGSKTMCPMHLCDIVFKGMMFTPPHNQFTLTVYDASPLVAELTGFDILLGWDVLHALDIHFGRDHSFTITLP